MEALSRSTNVIRPQKKTQRTHLRLLVSEHHDKKPHVSADQSEPRVFARFLCASGLLPRRKRGRWGCTGCVFRPILALGFRIISPNRTVSRTLNCVTSCWFRQCLYPCFGYFIQKLIFLSFRGHTVHEIMDLPSHLFLLQVLRSLGRVRLRLREHLAWTCSHSEEAFCGTILMINYSYK